MSKDKSLGKNVNKSRDEISELRYIMKQDCKTSLGLK